MNNYKGIRDRHLNIYWQYDGRPWLENNITKAFINSIDSLNETKKRIVFKNLFALDLPQGKMEVEFYLQKKPSPKLVNLYPENKRLMFCFSPTGKCWGYEGLESKDEKKLFDSIYKDLSSSIHDENKLIETTSKIVKEHMEALRGESIPDAWIFINIDNSPEFVIALENKLYDLDPTQINNHIEKSLMKKNYKDLIVYRKYEEVICCLDTLDEFCTNQFNEYMVLLNYTDVTDFKTCFLADEEIRRDLCIKFGKEILKKVHKGEIDERRWNVSRCHVNYEFLREINLVFDDNIVKLALSFGSTQNTAISMLNKLDDLVIENSHLKGRYQTFHLLYQRGRNINNSYYDGNFTIGEYLNYWKKNISYIHTYTPQEAILLYAKMYSDGVISESKYLSIKNQLEGKKNPVLVVPEINADFGWSYEEIGEMGIDEFARNLKEAVREALKAAKLISDAEDF